MEYQDFRAHLRLREHSVYVHYNSLDSTISCFKYRSGQCEWEIFTDIELASDWMIEPLADFEYRFTELN